MFTKRAVHSLQLKCLYLNIHGEAVEAHGTDESYSAGDCVKQVVFSINPEPLQL